MNVFILNTGRCGSMTFIRACQHINNYSAAHESRLKLIGEQRLQYPPQHIEADNRLAWYLGRLEQAYGDRAFYVHLRRDLQASAASYAKRRDFGLMKAFREGILLGGEAGQSDFDLAMDCMITMQANIQHFLENKTQKMDIWLETAAEDFPRFWQALRAEGDLDAALAEWQVRYNASDQ